VSACTVYARAMLMVGGASLQMSELPLSASARLVGFGFSLDGCELTSVVRHPARRLGEQLVDTPG